MKWNGLASAESNEHYGRWANNGHRESAQVDVMIQGSLRTGEPIVCAISAVERLQERD